jgi:S-adenosylmethionine-diacylgycerolhomoserine-N-methlytransferase
MSFAADIKVLWHLAVAPTRGETHAERLESFYGGQADAYDDFRARLLPGREELFAALPAPEHGVWVDMGGGTGRNLECLGNRLSRLGKIYVVDLAPSLLEVARRRVADHGWTNVETIAADATRFEPPAGQADVVTFSYSLTMIPDWFAAIEQAWRILRPGGVIGVVDFYVSRKHPQTDRARHSWATRHFWPAWFGYDNVFPHPDHLPFLERRFAPREIIERTAKLPYLPLVRAPYYIFVGEKRG